MRNVLNKLVLYFFLFGLGAGMMFSSSLVGLIIAVSGLAPSVPQPVISVLLLLMIGGFAFTLVALNIGSYFLRKAYSEG